MRPPGAVSVFRVTDCWRILTKPTSPSPNTTRQRPLPHKILRYNPRRRYEQQPTTDTHHDALRQHTLPVLPAQTRHHQTKDHQETPSEIQRSEPARVEERSTEHAHGYEETGLQTADPGDLRGGFVREVGELVVGLEDAEGVYDAEGVGPPGGRDVSFVF